MNTKNSISFLYFSNVLNYGKVIILLSFLFQSLSLYAQCTPTRYRLDSLQVSTFASGLNVPHGITIDSIGNVYITNSGTITKITPSGIVNTLAFGLGNLVDIVSDANGNMYATIADSGIVKKITPSGIVTTFASGLQCPTGIAIDCSNNLYVTKTSHHCLPGTASYSDNVYKILPDGSVGTLSTAFLEPMGITTDESGNVYVLSRGNAYMGGQAINGSVIKMTPSGTVSTLVSGLTGLSSIDDMTVDLNGNLYITRSDNGSIVKITASGTVSNLPVSFNAPYGIKTDLSGNLYIASSGDNTVSKIITGEIIALGSYTVGSYTHTTSGFYTDTLTAASVSGCDSIVTLNLTIMPIKQDTLYITECTAYTWAQTGITYTQSNIYSNPYNKCYIGFLNLTIKPTGRDTVFVESCDSYTWPETGITYTQSGFYNKTYTGAAANGCDSIITLKLTINNNRRDTVSITECGSYKWDQTGATYTQSGFYHKTYTGASVSGCDSIITLNLTVKEPIRNILSNKGQTSTFTTGLSAPIGIIRDRSGNFYTTNYGSNDIKKITPSGAISTLASGLNGPYGITNDNNNFYVTNYNNGTVSKIDEIGNVSTFATGLTYPTGITIDGNGNLYVTRIYSGSVSKITVDGIVSTFASGLNYPFGITIDGSGNLYVTSITDNLIYKISPSGTTSVLATGFNSPYAITIDGNGNLYVGNYNNNTVSKVTANNTINNFAIGLNRPEGIILDANGNLYVTNYGNGSISKVTPIMEACNSYTWSQNGQTYTNSGTYTDTIEGQATNGCDSIIILPLTIKQNTYKTVNQIQCGGSYNWSQNGQTYTSSGTYTDTIVGGATNGCDSIVSLNLTIKPIKHDTITVVASNSYTWNGNTYLSSGSYLNTYTAANGCDSIVTLNLTIKPISRDTIIQIACDSYFWAQTNLNYTQNGFYNDTLIGAAQNGYDSIVTLKLILKISRDIIHITANESYTWRGHTYTEGGLYSDTLTSLVTGCDSIKFLNLTINVPTTYEIPVVFHVIHTGQTIGTPQNPADSVLGNSIEFLNHIYAADGIIPGFPDTANGGVKIPIRFVLAKRTPDCQSTNGIERIDGSSVGDYASNGVNVTGASTGVPASSIYNLSTWDQSSYLNIWVVTGMAGGVDGFGTADGVIVTYWNLETATIPHEIGHFFGLSHTFQGSTSTLCAPNDSCERQGDGICDTEPHKQTASNTCPTGINECTGQPWGDVVYNFMNYSSCRNRFTAGQRDVMMVTLHGVGRLLSLPSNGGIPIVSVAQHDTVTSIAFGYRWHNSTYTTSGVYTIVEDCDTFILHFTFVPKPIAKDTVNVTACDNYTWTRNGKTYSQSNYYNDTIFTQDTAYLHTLHLTVNPTLRTNLNYIWKVDTFATSSLFHNLGGITNDHNGNLYVTELSAGQVFKIDAGGNVSIFASGLTVPTDIATDGNGNFYVTSSFSGQNIWKINAGGNVSIFATGVGYYCYAITTDNSGNFYTASGQSYRIKKISPDGSTITNYGPTVVQPMGITVDVNGNVYVSSLNSGTITKIDTSGNASIYATGFDHPEHLTTDADGNVYVSSEYDNAVHKITPSGSVSTIAVFNTSYTGGITADGSGNLYVPSLGDKYYVYKLSQVIVDTLWVCGSLTVGNKVHTKSGYYSDTLTSVVTGCDSIVTVTLGIKPITRDTVSITRCESYTWTETGQTYTQSGIYSKTYTAANGCDSVKILKLTVYQGTQLPIYQTVYQSYVWHGTTLNSSGTYTYNYNNDLGCPSTDTLYLTISPTPIPAESQCE